MRHSSSERRRKRRKGQERRKGGKRPAEDRRTGWDRRAATDRRKAEHPAAFSREAETEIRQWVVLPAAKRKKDVRDCPDCLSAASIRLGKAIKWAGGKTVQEVRCSACHRYLVIKVSK